jgi:hypothetical protein
MNMPCCAMPRPCWRSALTAVVWQRAQQVGLAAGAGRSQQATRPGIARAGAHQHAAQVSGPGAAAAPWQLKGRRLAAPVLPRGGDCSPLERSPGARGPGGTAVGAQLRGLDGWARELLSGVVRSKCDVGPGPGTGAGAGPARCMQQQPTAHAIVQFQLHMPLCSW